MNETEQFFYEYGGWADPPGREQCARDLAAAEARMRSGLFLVGIRDSQIPWDGDMPYDGPLYDVSLYRIDDAAHWEEGELIASLGCCCAESEEDPYLRVVAAELALEAIPVEVAA